MICPTVYCMCNRYMDMDLEHYFPTSIFNCYVRKKRVFFLCSTVEILYIINKAPHHHKDYNGISWKNNYNLHYSVLTQSARTNLQVINKHTAEQIPTKINKHKATTVHSNEPWSSNYALCDWVRLSSLWYRIYDIENVLGVIANVFYLYYIILYYIILYYIIVKT